MGRLITSAGYAGAIGGTVTVYGSSDRQTITVADVAGTVIFDASFNKGGDTIIFAKSAASYTIAQSGSSVIISDGDRRIVIPVGTVANTLQFVDGDRSLAYNEGIKLGAQIVTTTAATITASGTASSTLAADTSTQAATLVMNSEEVSVGGNVKVYGSASKETVNLLDTAGKVTFDASFNKGGDVLKVSDSAAVYSAIRSGSSVTLTAGDRSYVIPVGTAGLEMKFKDSEKNVLYNGGNFIIGDQLVDYSQTTLTVPLPKITYDLVSNAFIGNFALTGIVMATQSAAIDINQDGYKDIILATWKSVDSSLQGKNIGDIRTENRILILINHEGRYFLDASEQYIIGLNALSGKASDIAVADLNRDGKLDLIFACDREDGRAGTPYEYNTAYLSAMISEPNGYSIIDFGQRDWSQSIGAIYLNGNVYAAGSGYLLGSPGRESYQGGFLYKNGSMTEALKLNFQLSPNNFQFFSSRGTNETDLLIQTAKDPIVYGYEGYQYINGDWIRLGEVQNPGLFVRDVTITTYNNNVQPAKISFLDGYYFVSSGGGGAIFTSDVIDINNDGNKTVIMGMGLMLIPDFNPSADSIRQSGDTLSGFKIVAATIEDGKLKKVDLKIEGEVVIGTNSNHIDAFDVNGDGWDDIVVYAFTLNGFPYVYINQHDGSFKYDGSQNSDPSAWGKSLSIIDDFNNDGTPDLITYIGNGADTANGEGIVSMNFYIGSSMANYG